MALLDSLQFYFMHFMPYTKLPPDRTQGQWVDIPNAHFDPVEGNRLYKQYLDELVLGDQQCGLRLDRVAIQPPFGRSSG